jgi:hypothetical protein
LLFDFKEKIIIYVVKIVDRKRRREINIKYKKKTNREE